MSAPSALQSAGVRLLLFGGKGGVGKTTCATAAALKLARESPDRPLVLFSTDPAHSLKDSLGDIDLPGRIEVVEFDAPAYLEDFRRRHGPTLQAIAERGTFLDSDDIRRFLSLSLPGMDELLGFLDVARRAQEASENDRIVLDTAPSGHTLRLLAMPELLRGWVDALDTLLAKHRFLRQQLGRRRASDELDRFVEELHDSVSLAESLMHDPERCRFIPVMLAEELSVRETASLLDMLDELQIRADEIIVNMLAPEGCAICSGMREQQVQKLRHLPDQFRGRMLWGAPMQIREIRGGALESFWDEVTPVDVTRTAPSYSGYPIGPRVEGPAPAPSARSTLLFFAGKGGVGKTTLASATALRLAREWPERKMLLFSTDPAHSLSDCLARRIGPKVTQIRPGLSALEIDVAAELEALKQQYHEEIDRFFGSLLKGFDMPFDREVAERLIDLSPPGLDEILSVTRAIDYLQTGTFNLLVFDCAPTGHLVRLLETPELIESWLRAFFELFLKYKDVFRIPRIADRLVELSKSLRRFRALLEDRERSSLYAVSVPTRMALEETLDLFAACSRIGMAVPLLFLNLMTPEGGCAFCSERARFDRAMDAEFSRLLSARRTRVFRQPEEPRGIEHLEELGNLLFEARAEKGEAARYAPPA